MDGEIALWRFVLARGMWEVGSGNWLVVDDEGRGGEGEEEEETQFEI